MTTGHIGVGGSKIVTPTWAQQATDHLRKADPVMAKLIAQVGGMPEFWIVNDCWQAIVRGIRHNLVGATVAYGFIDSLRTMYKLSGDEFPTPKQIAETPQTRLITEGRMTANHAKALVAIANMIESQEIDLEAFEGLDDVALMRQLDALPGIGPWTAAMVMLFYFQRPNVIVSGDVGLWSAVRDSYKIPDKWTDKQVDQFIAKQARTVWTPYASGAAYFLWKSHGAFVPGLSAVTLEAEATAKATARAEPSPERNPGGAARKAHAKAAKPAPANAAMPNKSGKPR